MNEPWFDPNLYAWIPGTALGVCGGLWGAAVGMFAPSGKNRALVMGTWAVLALASVALLILGVIALAAGQPYGIWYGFLLAGVIGTVVLGPLYFVARQRYNMAEMQRMHARDL